MSGVVLERNGKNIICYIFFNKQMHGSWVLAAKAPPS
jgi:hypothetical protein